MNTLGIYFGTRFISVVETKDKKPVNNIQIPMSAISTGELLEEKVPEEIKIVTFLKDELSKRNIETKKAAVCLSGRDLMVRTFEMAALPREEMANAISFEAKKYIPFKLEELVSDSQWKKDKNIKKNRVLFVGIKKETLDKYISILNQLELKINLIEYSGFSVLRLFKLANIKEAAITAVVNVDILEDDEVNFLVLEKGFLLFSRDISSSKEAQPSAVIEKLKREMRISLDYYHRKFPTKNIEKVFFVSTKDCRQELEPFIKELGLPAEFVESAKYIEGQESLSLSFVKGYCASLSEVIKISPSIDLLAAKTKKIKPFKKLAIEPSLIKSQLLGLTAGQKLDIRILVSSLSICVLVSIIGLWRIANLQKEIKKIIEKQPQLASVKPNSDNKELGSIDSIFKLKVKAVNDLMKKQVYLTELLDVMPRILPEGMWLANFSFQPWAYGMKLILDGTVYLGDNNKEIELINNFRSRLRENSVCVKYFQKFDIVSLGLVKIKDTAATKFLISCGPEEERLEKKRK